MKDIKGAGGVKPSLLRNPVAWVQSVADRVSYQFLVCIFVTHHVLKGLVVGGGDEGLIGKPVEFLLGALHLPAGRLQAMVAVGGMAPWVLKPLIGVLSDTVPFWRYKKIPYLVFLTVLACASIANLGSGLVVTPVFIVGSLFFASLQVAGATLLVDAKQSEIAKEHAGLGPELVTFRETCMNSGMVLSGFIVGPLIAYYGPRAPYIVALPLSASVFLMAWGNWLQEERLPSEENRVNLRAIRQNPLLFGLGMLLVPLLLILGLSSVAFVAERSLTAIALATAVVVAAAYVLFIRPEISGPVVFYFLMRCCNLQITGALFYFFTDSPTAFPEGPHFSPLTYATAITTVAISGRMLGFMTARDLFSSWRYERTLLFAMPLVACTQLLLVPMLLRWNLVMGIPDQAWVLAWTFVDMVARGWRQFPFSIMLLQATPRGLEASTLALNTGVVNMGATLSSFFGAYVLHYFSVTPSGHEAESASFDYLWKAQCIAAVCPLLVLPLMPFLMPRQRQNEAIITDEPTSATHGSLASVYGWL